MSAKDQVLQYLKEAHCVCAPRYTAFKLQLSETTVRRAAQQLVKEGLVRRTSMWVTAGWQYRRAGYVVVYQAIDSDEV